uniref:Protein arginine methyltransferase 5 n=1 Tax=Capra hircus TaxID=9925 RepID=A0A8C2PJD7_CAPHI
MAAMAVGGAGGSRVSSGRDLNCVPEIADTLGAVAKQGFSAAPK